MSLLKWKWNDSFCCLSVAFAFLTSISVSAMIYLHLLVRGHEYSRHQQMYQQKFPDTNKRGWTTMDNKKSANLVLARALWTGMDGDGC